MKFKFEISDEKTHNLVGTARDKLDELGKKFIEDILDESARIEEGRRDSTTNPEITSAIICDAAAVLKNSPQKRKITIKQRLLQILEKILLASVGLLFDLDKFKTSEWRLPVFLIVFTVAIIVVVYLTFNNNEN